MLDLNVTLLIQLANFLITLFVLNLLLIKPIRKIIRERRALMDGLAGDAAGFEQKAKNSLADYEAQLTKARQEAALAREGGRAAGQKEQQVLVDEAQKQAQGILGEARDRLNAEAAACLTELRSQVGKLSQQLAGRVLNG